MHFCKFRKILELYYLSKSSCIKLPSKSVLSFLKSRADRMSVDREWCLKESWNMTDWDFIYWFLSGRKAIFCIYHVLANSWIIAVKVIIDRVWLCLNILCQRRNCIELTSNRRIRRIIYAVSSS